ncbi:mannosyltransferase family protein [Hamadaea sp. NPDC050747]|uniref:mannosyltransferase family protein n=1 Tax=Hamadaea sp. NPDC050747 TaxID=3155789 RepID=UPI00340721B8
MPDETLALEGASPAVRSAIPAQAAEEAAPSGTAGGEHAAPPPAGPSMRERWRQSFIVGFWTWLSGLALYAVVTFAAWVPFEGLAAKAGDPPDSVSVALDAWNRWDTTWYLIIADTGYHWDTRATAFWPLYPMTVRAANAVLPGGSFGAALAVSLVCCLVALVLTHRLAAEVMDERHARRAAFYLLAFPTGFYLVAAYNESMFIALAVGSLYCMRRGHWWIAGALAGLAGATRMAGVLLGAAFVYEYLRQRGWSVRRIRWDALSIALVPSGLAAYMLYLQQSFGSATHFMESQKAWFHDGYQAPWTTIGQVAKMIHDWTPMFSPDNFRNVANLATALLMIALLTLALVGPWKLGPEDRYLVVFAAITLLLPLISPIHSHYPLSSLWRYSLECTAAFLVLAKMGRNASFDRFFSMGAVGLQGAMIIVFLQNNFVA